VLTEPQQTQADLHFEVLGFPVRIHPLFWVIGAFFGYNSAPPDDKIVGMLMGIAAIFISILVHELGHTVMYRYFGKQARIVLYFMGGLAIADGGGGGYSNPYMPSNSYRPVQDKGRFRWSKMIISFAGPAAGFMLAAVVYAFWCAGLFAAGGTTLLMDWDAAITVYEFNPNLYRLYHYMMFINVAWGLVNLLPVYPLDGGQIMWEIMIGFDPWRGQTRALWVSIFTAGLITAFAFTVKDWFVAILFGMLAFQNFQMLQRISGGGGRPW